MLDLTDKKIINHLQENGKITVKELSEKLFLSATAIYERIKKLEKNKIIDKYVALINRANSDKGFMVLCQIKLIQHHNKYIEKFEKEVLLFDEVIECFNTSGDSDYQLKIVVKDMVAFKHFLNTKLTSLNYIGSTYSTFIISEVKNSTCILV